MRPLRFGGHPTVCRGCLYRIYITMRFLDAPTSAGLTGHILPALGRGAGMLLDLARDMAAGYRPERAARA